MIFCCLGYPVSRVSWWMDGILLDSAWKEISTGKSRNTLQLLLTRDMNRKQIECRGENNNQTEPVSATSTINILLAPRYVKITHIPGEMSAGKEYQLECTAGGSNPPPLISWRLWDSSPLAGATQDDTDAMVSISRLRFTPGEEDEGKLLFCCAKNSVLNSTLETSIRVQVSSVPRVLLDYGASIRKDRIKEGDDIYLNCHISASPQTFRESWFYQGELLDKTSGLFSFHENSLVIRNVTKERQGDYSCSATNSEGTGFSNIIKLQVQCK
ncbi:nephrin isoform X2 [Eurytemora carolleeae]|uniref:nephrin isoform X2 n=1 Tax=Eurytemora carolleeae TaxID=1294199 RepID=UPI000C759EC4|nr:nephrin isoform X2 [Eurytemora carolleeae]|eukprot:XP_023334497.1 nephrin-like isoform X2 [Eurytemora affinis]